MPTVEFEPTISAGERLQTYALNISMYKRKIIYQLKSTNLKGKMQ